MTWLWAGAIIAALGGLLAGLAILFVYAFVAALVVTPFLLLFFFFLNRHLNSRWREILQEQQSYRRGDGTTGPIIDHDPNDLPG